MAYPKRLLWIIFVVGLCCSSTSSIGAAAAAVATDCERPPHVDNASVNVVDDETGDLVSATYACAAGYRLLGEAELFCDLDTDEWQGDPPACRAETTSTSTTVAPNFSGQPNRRRKAGPQNIQEDTSIDSAYARQLDLSCVGRERGESVRPPTIDNAYVTKYNRRKKDGNIFLVAFYECEDDFDLEDMDNDHLYCSKDRWIGMRPRCLAIGGGDNQDDYDGDGGDEDADDDADDDDDNDNEDGDDYDDGRENEVNEEINPPTTPASVTEITSSTLIATTNSEPPTAQTPDIRDKNTEATEINPIEPEVDNDITRIDDNEKTSDTNNDNPDDDDNELENVESNDINGIDESISENIHADPENDVDDDNEESNDLVYETNDIHMDVRVSSTTTTSTTTTTTIAPQPQQPAACGTGRNECDHGCRMLYDDEEDAVGRTECFCSVGFTLDVDDGRTCHDVDECAVDNGGCEQTCTNLPGSMECSCTGGLQIDTTNGKSCVDINECLLRNGHGLCQDTCTNTFGGYRCSCDHLPGTRLGHDGHRCVDAGDCLVNNGGCTHKCVSSHGRVFCQCDAGYVIGGDFRTCKDINECEEPNIRNQCKYGCINTPGSYRCEQPPSDNEVYDTAEENTTDDRPTSQEVTTDKQCADGLRLSATSGECVDIDECSERQHGCDYCRNVFGGFECTCPAGFELDDNERTCRDVDECRQDDGAAVCSHDCLNTVGSFRCSCPGGLDLHTDGRTCQPIDVCQENARHCEPGRCVPLGADSYRCVCPAGFEEKSRRCHDIDECAWNTHNCSHSCENTRGAFRCGCPNGWRLADDGRTCVDVDECEDAIDADADLCDEEMNCINTHGSYRCVCPEGRALDAESGRCAPASGCARNNGGCSHICGADTQCACPLGMRLAGDARTCELVHPCDVNNGGCAQACNRVDLSCSCAAGWELHSDGKRCTDVNECDDNNGGCGQQCSNEPGSFRCECLDGFAQDPLRSDQCRDIDECEVANGGCSHGCRNEEGSHHCVCPAGFRLDEDSEQQCLDVNECLQNNGNCSHDCHNAPGSMRCTCPTGHSLLADARTCAPVNACHSADNGGCSHTCTFRAGAAVCSCPAGFMLQDKRTCADIDECSLENGGCEYGCENRNGSHVCLCEVGYQLAANGRSCTDIDECIEDNGNCSNICINLIGSHACACETGYRLSTEDRQTCEDIDECSEVLHGCSHECRNVDGTYECGCPDGYAAVDHFQCEDVDECAGERGSECVHGCTNTLGGFNCTCPLGHRQRADGISCEDIDECTDVELHGCSHDCVNRVGAWECTCPDGFDLGVDLKTCRDRDECTDGRAQCSHTCENVAGSYRCSCPAGFRLDDDQHGCVDIDECHFANAGCSHECVNERGAFRCACPGGHSLQDDGLQCQTDDLCAFGNGGCKHECNVVDGGVQCSCQRGFVISRGDNSSCIDVDECVATPAVCQHECVNVVGSYKCRCHRGYRLNELDQCVDVDECERANGGCASDARCINLAGGFRCMCQPGFRLSSDKRTCVEIRDMCRPKARPENGNVKCIRSRHRTQLFYKTKCSFSCNQGYRMLGPAIVHCNGTGYWNSAESTMCISETCPQFEKPSHGIITPSACLTGGIYPGERCILHCDTGYKAVERRIAVCSPQLQWQHSANLSCQAVPALAIKPFIRCPPDATMVLKPEQRSILVRMERPRTNVDWVSLVDAHPAWGKRLESQLDPGVHTVTFRARSASSNAVDICRTVITVKELRPPAVTNCPNNMVVQLRAGESAREINWQEPSFHSNTRLKEVFKSKLPGESLTPGVHPIKYVAIDQDELSANCEFNITVQTYFHPKRTVIQHLAGQRINAGLVQQELPAAAVRTHPNGLQPRRQPHDLGPAEAYVMCPNRVAMKLDTTFPYKLPRGCVIKHVKLPSYNHIRRRHSNSNNMLQHYSSWDHPKKGGLFSPQYRRQFD